jgi:hypothetical protein
MLSMSEFDWFGDDSHDVLRRITAILAEHDRRTTGVEEAVFRKDGEVWTLSFEGKTVHVPDALGFGYIGELLRTPQMAIEAAQLAAKPRIISDNGPQFIAKDFKEFIRISGMTHVRTSPYYPQSNGKIERWHKSLKGECIRPGTPLSLEDARRLVEGYVEHYNNVRLNSAVGYITPKDMLAGRQQEIHAERDRKLEAARRQRQSRRRQAA